MTAPSFADEIKKQENALMILKFIGLATAATVSVTGVLFAGSKLKDQWSDFTLGIVGLPSSVNATGVTSGKIAGTIFLGQLLAALSTIVWLIKASQCCSSNTVTPEQIAGVIKDLVYSQDRNCFVNLSDNETKSTQEMVHDNLNCTNQTAVITALVTMNLSEGDIERVLKKIFPEKERVANRSDISGGLITRNLLNPEVFSSVPHFMTKYHTVKLANQRANLVNTVNTVTPIKIAGAIEVLVSWQHKIFFGIPFSQANEIESRKKMVRDNLNSTNQASVITALVTMNLNEVDIQFVLQDVFVWKEHLNNFDEVQDIHGQKVRFMRPEVVDQDDYSSVHDFMTNYNAAKLAMQQANLGNESMKFNS